MINCQARLLMRQNPHRLGGHPPAAAEKPALPDMGPGKRKLLAKFAFAGITLETRPLLATVF
jgi:hypothetical protein